MANYMLNTLTVRGAPELVDAFIADPFVDLAYVTPLGEQRREEVPWLEDPLDPRARVTNRPEPGAVVYTFDTRWEAPVNLVVLVSSSRPALSFELSWWDEGWLYERGWRLTIQAGRILAQEEQHQETRASEPEDDISRARARRNLGPIPF